MHPHQIADNRHIYNLSGTAVQSIDKVVTSLSGLVVHTVKSSSL